MPSYRPRVAPSPRNGESYGSYQRRLQAFERETGQRVRFTTRTGQVTTSSGVTERSQQSSNIAVLEQNLKSLRPGTQAYYNTQVELERRKVALREGIPLSEVRDSIIKVKKPTYNLLESTYGFTQYGNFIGQKPGEGDLSYIRRAKQAVRFAENQRVQYNRKQIERATGRKFNEVFPQGNRVNAQELRSAINPLNKVLDTGARQVAVQRSIRAEMLAAQGDFKAKQPKPKRTVGTNLLEGARGYGQRIDNLVDKLGLTKKEGEDLQFSTLYKYLTPNGAFSLLRAGARYPLEIAKGAGQAVLISGALPSLISNRETRKGTLAGLRQGFVESPATALRSIDIRKPDGLINALVLAAAIKYASTKKGVSKSDLTKPKIINAKLTSRRLSAIETLYKKAGSIRIAGKKYRFVETAKVTVRGSGKILVKSTAKIKVGSRWKTIKSQLSGTTRSRQYGKQSGMKSMTKKEITETQLTGKIGKERAMLNQLQQGRVVLGRIFTRKVTSIFDSKITNLRRTRYTGVTKGEVTTKVGAEVKFRSKITMPKDLNPYFKFSQSLKSIFGTGKAFKGKKAQLAIGRTREPMDFTGQRYNQGRIELDVNKVLADMDKAINKIRSRPASQLRTSGLGKARTNVIKRIDFDPNTVMIAADQILGRSLFRLNIVPITMVRGESEMQVSALSPYVSRIEARTGLPSEVFVGSRFIPIEMATARPKVGDETQPVPDPVVTPEEGTGDKYSSVTNIINNYFNSVSSIVNIFGGGRFVPGGFFSGGGLPGAGGRYRGGYGYSYAVDTRREYNPDVRSRILGIRSRDKSQLLSIGRTFTGLENRPLVF